MYEYEYPRPAVSVDIVVLAGADGDRQVLLIERKQPPFERSWALPGGFLEMDETLEAAAARELAEETGLRGIQLRQVAAFSAVERDPRGRVISVAFRGEIAQPPPLQAGDDAGDARWFSLAQLPRLAFDHAEILAAALRPGHD